jgi:hypothetical protein
MKINYQKSRDAHHPRQLFVLVNEFDFAAFPVRPRHMALAHARPARHRGRVIRLHRKGAAPC